MTGQEQTTAWSARKPGLAATAYLLSYLLIAVIGGVVVAPLRSPIIAGIVVTVIGAAVLLVSLLLVLSICRLRMSPGREVIWTVAMLVVFAVVRPAVFAVVGKWVGHPAAGKRIAEALSVVPGQFLLGNTALIVWAACLGRLVSRLMREGKLLLPVAVVAAIADIITVFWGVVAHVSETAPEVVATFSAAAPVAPPPNVSAPILSAVGIGDFLFLAAFLAVAIRHAMRPVRTMWASFAVMLVAPLAYWFFPSATGMPGLPFIAAAVLWANWRHIEFTSEEKRALVFVGALVLAAAMGLLVVLRR